MKKQQTSEVIEKTTVETAKSQSSQASMPEKLVTILCIVLLVLITIISLVFVSVPFARQIKANKLLNDEIGNDPHEYANSYCIIFEDNYLLDSQDHKSNIELCHVFTAQPKWLQDGLKECSSGNYTEQAKYAAALQKARASMSEAVVNQCYALGYALFTTPDKFDVDEIEHIRSNFNCRLLDGVAG